MLCVDPHGKGVQFIEKAIKVAQLRKEANSSDSFEAMRKFLIGVMSIILQDNERVKLNKLEKKRLGKE